MSHADRRQAIGQLARAIEGQNAALRRRDWHSWTEHRRDRDVIVLQLAPVDVEAAHEIVKHNPEGQS